MLYIDFDWDVDKEGILLDQAFDLDKLTWKIGDYFRLVDIGDGTIKLMKIDSLEEFIIKGVENGRS